VEVARSNAEANGVSHLVSVELGTLPRGERHSFDLVAANIVADVIYNLAHPLVGSLKAGGVLIAGGIIGELVKGVGARLEEVGAEIIEVLYDGEWRTIIAQAKGEG
jgi:ribosomal protein L11 methyltransferase